jgi:DNA-binding NarL/FixJ family response regulator
MVGVILYEDNNDLRESLGNLIAASAELSLLGAFSRANEAAKQVKDLRPDVVLMDIDMPGMNGIEAVKRIRSTDQPVQIIMLTVFDDNQHVLDAICAGASGYLLKKHISEQLPDAIMQVLHGEAPMSPGIARLIVESMQEKARPAANNYNLTPREKEILGLLSKGNSYKMISTNLFLSLDTVRTHIKNIYGKLQVHSQTEAIAKASNERLV